jgi:hypothetical protein
VKKIAFHSQRFGSMARPRPGDKILVLKEPWLSMIVDGRKKMEIRGSALSAGKYFLGHKKKIYGVMTTGPPRHLPDTQVFQQLRAHHRVSGSLPYKKTFGLPILQVSSIRPPISYQHPKGAVSIVKFR